MHNHSPVTKSVVLLALASLLVAWVSKPVEEHIIAPFTSDGCSLFLNRSPIGGADWCHCCLAHDLAYWRGGTWEDRLQADRELLACVQGASGSRELAELMFAGVRVGGGPFLATPYRWSYGWPEGRGYQALSEKEQAAADRRERQYQLSNPSLACTNASLSKQ